MRQGRCYEAVRQTCEALVVAEMMVHVDRVFDGGVESINCTFFSRGDGALPRESSPEISSDE